MKKWVFIPIIVLIIALIFLVLPWGIGMLVQTKYTKMLKEFSRSDNIEFTLESYQRHWFDSDIIVNVTANPQKLLKTPHASDTPVSFRLTQHIKHGPLLSLTPIHEKIHKYMGLALITSQIDPTIGRIEGISLMGFNAGLISVLTTPQAHYRSKVSDLILDMSGIVFILENTYDLQKLSGEIHVAHLELHTGELIQNIDALNTQFDLVRGEGDLFLGIRKVDINKIGWKLPGGKANIELDGFAMDTENGIRNEKIDARTHVIVQKVLFDHMNYGRQEIELTVKDVDLPAFLLLRKELSNLDQTTDVSLADTQGYIKIVSLLISKGLFIDLKKLNLSTQWGNPQLDMQLDFAPQSHPPTTLLEISNSLTAKADIKLPSVFLIKLLEYIRQFGNIVGLPPDTVTQDDIMQQVKIWTDNKWLLMDENGYKTEILYENNQLYINSEPFDSQKLILQKAGPDDFIQVKIPAMP